MTTQLNWTEIGGKLIGQEASAHEFSYTCVAVNAYRNQWYPIVGNQRYDSKPTLEEAKAVCQSHHDAVFKAVEEAYRRGKEKGVSLTENDALFEEGTERSREQ